MAEHKLIIPYYISMHTLPFSLNLPRFSQVMQSTWCVHKPKQKKKRFSEPPTTQHLLLSPMDPTLAVMLTMIPLCCLAFSACCWPKPPPPFWRRGAKCLAMIRGPTVLVVKVEMMPWKGKEVNQYRSINTCGGCLVEQETNNGKKMGVISNQMSVRILSPWIWMNGKCMNEQNWNSVCGG